MSGALVRGGNGSEVALYDILPSHLRGFSTRVQSEPIARKYEELHPGSVVVCDWELFDDADITAMDREAQQVAINDRRALALRRKSAHDAGPITEPTRGGDPERARELLRRVSNDMTRLDPTHPDYQRMFEDYARQINLLEDACGETKTAYKLGRKPQTERPVSDTRKQELATKVERYRSLPTANRRASIEAAIDPTLTQMFLDVESEQPLRDAIVLKLAAMDAVSVAQ